MPDLTRLTDLRAFLLALGLKLVLVALMFAEQGRKPFGESAVAPAFGDTHSYFAPIDHLLEHGTYSPDLRMPGYGAVYLVPRLLFDPETARAIVLVLQITLAAAATMALLRCAALLGASGRVASIVFLVAALGMWTNAFDIFLLSESFSVSALVFASLFFLKAWQKDDRLSLLYSGVFMAWAVFMKPICMLPLVLFASAWWLGRPGTGPARTAGALYFLLPFVVVDAVWTVRNAMVNGRFAPLSNGWFIQDGDSVFPELQQMTMAMGGNAAYWTDPDADIRWFNVGVERDRDGRPKPNTRPASSPAWWATEACPMDSLSRIRTLNLQRQDTLRPALARAQDAQEVIRLCRSCSAAFAAERPFAHHVRARGKALWTFVVNPGVPYPFRATFSRMPWYLKAFKLVHVALYGIVLVLATASFLRSWSRPSPPLHRLLTTCFALGLLAVPLVTRLTENRYMATVWPFAVLCAALLSTARTPASSIERA